MIKIFCDGLVEPKNPGGWLVWAWIAHQDGQVSMRKSTLDIPCEIACAYGHVPPKAGNTNNVAEYMAIGHALKWLADNGHVGNAFVMSDSQVVVEQIAGKFACNSELLRPFMLRCRDLVQQTRACVIWVPREYVKAADRLTREEYARAAGSLPAGRKKVAA